MKAGPFFTRAFGSLLVFSGQEAAQEQEFIENRLEKISDPLQGAFRTFLPFQMGNQTLRALFDTGSSDLVVPRTGSDICRSELQQCDREGTGFLAGSFDPDKGDVQNTTIPLDTKFTGGATFEGNFIDTPVSAGRGNTDSLTLQLGLIERGSTPPGSPLFSVFGVGPVEGESSGPKTTYPNFPARLKEENMVKSNAFGLYIGDYRFDVNASVVWGGVDEAKFDGELRAAPLVRTQNGVLPSFVINMTSVTVTDKDGRPKKIGRGAKNDSDVGQGCSSARNGDVSSSRGRERGSSSNCQGNGSFSKIKDMGPSAWRHIAARRSIRGRGVGGSTQHGVYARSPRQAEGEILHRQERGNLMAEDGPPVALLDTGAPDVLLSMGTVQGIAQALGADFDEERGMGLVDCSLLDGNTALTFGFNNDEISIVMPLDTIELGDEFAQHPLGADGPPRPDEPSGRELPPLSGGALSSGRSRESGTTKGQGAAGGCKVAIEAFDPRDPAGLNVLGGSFLQSAYVVFDMDSEVLMMAQAKPNATESKIRAYVPNVKW